MDNQLFCITVFKIFTLLEDRFEEACNLRVGKNLNLNFSCNDVAWNLIDGKFYALKTSFISPHPF